MYDTDVALSVAHKPFDIVTNVAGDVGIIQEVSINSCQESSDSQLSYAVRWLVGNERKFAWFDHNELKVHCNLFIAMGEMACNPRGNNANWVSKLVLC